MVTLDVPGAQIYYEVRGKGPLFILIPGGNGDAPAYDRIARVLEKWFQVVTYDRRGFSRSHLTGAQDYSQRLATDADDAQRLVSHLSNEPATVFGSSSGAVVALELLSRHPSVVRMLISHEGPFLAVIPGGGQAERAMMQQTYDIYRAQGPFPALEHFTAKFLTVETERAAMQLSMDARRGGFAPANTLYWFERELPVYPFAEFDLGPLIPEKQKILLVIGRESAERGACGIPSKGLAEKLGLSVQKVPGGHFGFAFHAAEFGREMLLLLRQKNQFYTDL